MPLFVHIGLHKTATTYLQVDVFPRLRGINYIDGNDPALLPWKRRMYMQDPLIFDVDQARDEIVDRMKGVRSLLSTEALSGSPMGQYLNRDIILQKLKAMFPNAKIILGLRAQQDIIWSLYKNYVRKGGTCRLDQMLDPYGTSLGRDFIDLDSFRYGPYLDRISSLFGRENLHVLLFEDLTLDRDRLMGEFLEFLGAELEAGAPEEKRAVGIGDDAVPVIRALNNAVMARGRESAGMLSATRRVSKVVDRTVASLPRRNGTVADLEVLRGLAGYWTADNTYIDREYGLHLADRQLTREKYLL